jgi:hypothetical protein
VKKTIRDRVLAGRDAWSRVRVATARARRTTGVTSRTQLQLANDAARAAPRSVTVNCVVFSKDRAMQLDACLRSIMRYAPYDGPILVIYKASSEQFAQAYRSLDSTDGVRLVPESESFHRDAVQAIDPGHNYTVFHTDDDVFFRAPPAAPLLPDGCAAFSLRLGENTTYCYSLNRTQAVPPTVGEGLFIAWDWTRAQGDFAYPLSLDGHILATPLLLKILARMRFSNPNELERELNFRRHLAPPLMLAFRKSCLVSLPANVVSETHRNRSGEHPENSPEALNARFLAGERIDLDAMDFSDVQAAHQEVPLIFRDAS